MPEYINHKIAHKKKNLSLITRELMGTNWYNLMLKFKKNFATFKKFHVQCLLKTNIKNSNISIIRLLIKPPINSKFTTPRSVEYPVPLMKTALESWKNSRTHFKSVKPPAYYINACSNNINAMPNTQS